MLIEQIDDPVGPDGSAGTLVTIVRGGYVPHGTNFHTGPNDQQQVATIRRSEGWQIEPHVHKKIRREVWHTPEVFVVKSGRMKLVVYNYSRFLVGSAIIKGGDVVIVHGGGHGIEFLEETILVEIKQGPYFGRDADKEEIR